MKIEVVKGDIADPASYEQYLQGKDGAFVNADCKWNTRQISGFWRSMC